MPKLKLRRRQRNGSIKKWFGSGVNSQLTKWIRDEARRDGVSYSFIIANAVSHASGIPIEDIRDRKEKKLIKFPKVG